MKRLIALSAAALLLIFSVAGCSWLLDNRVPNFRSDASFFVQNGDTPHSIVEKIAQQTSIRFPKRLEKVLEKGQVQTYMKPGHYYITKDCSSIYVARMINNGWQKPVKMVLSGTIRRVGDIATKVSRNMKVDSATVAQAITSAKTMSRYGYTPQTAFALFLPDTYEMYWDASMDDILKRMKKAHDQFWNPEREAKAKSMGYTPMQVTILASIVQCESNYVPDYSKIAGVYLNRLKKGMKLEACPTVAYCYNFELNRVLDKHLKVDSPYNTYRNKGLPPGPICSPSKEAIDAVLNADTKDGYLFFCASSNFDGTHKFASSYAAHSRNAQEFRRELDRRKKEK